MALNLPGSALLHLALLLNRLALGFYFAFLGFNKVRGEVQNGFGSFYRGENFQGMAPGWLPQWFAMPFGYGLPWVELIVGALFMIGLFTRLWAAVLALVLLGISIAQIEAGSFFHGAEGIAGPYHTNAILFTLALLFIVTGGGRFSIDGLWRRKKD